MVLLKKLRKAENYIRENQHKLVFHICVLIGALLIFRDVVGISVNKYLLLVVCSVAMPFLAYGELLCLLGFLFALTFGIPSNYIFIIAALVMMVKRKFNVSTIVVFSTFVCWDLVLTFAYGTTSSFTTYLGYFMRLFFFFFILSEDFEGVNCRRVVKYFTAGITLFIVIVAAIYLKDNPLSHIINGYTRLGNISDYWMETGHAGMIMSTNTNNVAYFCIAGMATALSLFHVEKKPIWLCLFFVIFALGALTVSKAFYLCAMLQVAVFAYTVFKGEISRRKKIIFASSFVIVLLALLVSGVFSAFLKRFEGLDFFLQDVRSEIFVQYLAAFFTNPAAMLFGGGTFSYHSVYGIENSVHNGTEQVLISYGVFGFTAFVAFMVLAIKKHISPMKKFEGKTKLMLALPLFSTLIFVQTIQFLNPADLMLPVIIAVIALKIGVDKETEKEAGILELKETGVKVWKVIAKNCSKKRQ